MGHAVEILEGCYVGTLAPEVLAKLNRREALTLDTIWAELIETWVLLEWPKSQTRI
jgi:hypothetical protein